jgi:hypothetical protein
LRPFAASLLTFAVTAFDLSRKSNQNLNRKGRKELPQRKECLS